MGARAHDSYRVVNGIYDLDTRHGRGTWRVWRVWLTDFSAGREAEENRGDEVGGYSRCKFQPRRTMAVAMAAEVMEAAPYVTRARARDHSRPWPHFFSSAAGEPADRLLLVRAWLGASKSSAGPNSHDRRDKLGTLGQDRDDERTRKWGTRRCETYRLYNVHFLIFSKLFSETVRLFLFFFFCIS